MKKLTKLNINPEKVMKNEELVTLRGGEYGNDCSATTKIDACKGKAEGNDCCWTYNGMPSYGHCRNYYSTGLHCSDLN